MAHALYDLIGPGSAFLLLAAVALMTLVAAILHGPAVASYGLLASYGSVLGPLRPAGNMAAHGLFVSLASAVFVLAAVAKVFLFDMAGLDGVWRAFSFIGLGIVLIGIGLLYQRLLTHASGTPPQEEESAA